MHEALAGLTFRDAMKTLVGLGHIVPSATAYDMRNNTVGRLYSLPGYPKIRLYEIGADLLADIEGEF